MAAKKKPVKGKKEAGTVSLEDRRALLRATIAKEFDEHAYVGTDDKGLDVERVPFGIPNIDYVLGGGIPKGRIIELFGPESSGKTTFALQVMKQLQDEDPEAHVCIIDLEHALDIKYMYEGLGLDRSRTEVIQPADLIAGCNVLGRYAESGLYAGIVFDSTAVKAKDETVATNYSGNDSGMGAEARALGTCLSKVNNHIADNGMIVCMISQIRHKIGVMFGSPEVTTGGNSPKYYASIRIDLRIKERKETWNKVQIKIVKNKVAPPYRVTEAWVEFGQGFNRTKNIFEYGIEQGIITNSGAWFYYNGEQIAQGRERALAFVVDNPGILDEIEQSV